MNIQIRALPFNNEEMPQHLVISPGMSEQEATCSSSDFTSTLLSFCFPSQERQSDNVTGLGIKMEVPCQFDTAVWVGLSSPVAAAPVARVIRPSPSQRFHGAPPPAAPHIIPTLLILDEYYPAVRQHPILILLLYSFPSRPSQSQPQFIREGWTHHGCGLPVSTPRSA